MAAGVGKRYYESGMEKLTQILNGHGWFGSYQRRFHQSKNSEWSVYENIEDTVKHCFFFSNVGDAGDVEGRVGDRGKRNVSLLMGRRIDRATLIDIMLESEER